MEKYLNFENIGIPICIIKDTNKKQLKDKIIYLDEKEENIHGFDHFQLEGDGKLQLTINPKSERTIWYVVGSSGSGKSFFVGKLCAEYLKYFPKNPIYMISTVSDDSSLDGIKMNHIVIGDNLLEETVTAKDFQDSLVIIDDADQISNTKHRKAVQAISNSILEIGRHYNVSCAFTNHVACAGHDTKRILNESHSITLFPRTAGNKTLKYLLDSYLGLDKHEIQKVKKLKSRAVTILKTFPKVVVSEKNVFILGNE